MNLRILKKLSKRAAPLLAALGVTDKQFPAERWEDYTESSGHDRKHRERRRARHPMEPRHTDIHLKPRRGQGVVVLSEAHLHPWPGTIMLGWNVGYETPEWEENDAWSILERTVLDHWTEYREVDVDEDVGHVGYALIIHRRFRNPSDIFRAVPEVVEARRREVEKRQTWWAEQQAKMASAAAA
jgi:hypothetical protein